MPNLTRLFSRDIRETRLSDKKSSTTTEQPPPYTKHAQYDADDAIEPPDLTAGFSNLTFSDDHPVGPGANDCIAHLKLLECFYRLQQSIGSTDGLYGIYDRTVLQFKLAKNEEAKLLAKLAEKRWAVFVTRAVDRFEAWSNARFPCQGGRPTVQDIIDGSKAGVVSQRCHFVNSVWTSKWHNFLMENELPPLDVLLVWHAFSLNPRAYFEDCFRKGMMMLWYQDMPWNFISPAIDSKTFEYAPSLACQDNFVQLAKRSWDNTHDDVTKQIRCPTCRKAINVDYTTIDEATADTKDTRFTPDFQIETMLSAGTGYCDKKFRAQCKDCQHKINMEYLRFGKFCRDLEALVERRLPMPGTVYSLRGYPGVFADKVDGTAEGVTANVNEFFRGKIAEAFLSPPKKANSTYTMSHVKAAIERTLKDKTYVADVRKPFARTPLRAEKAAIRRLMSRYWDNASESSMDLVGAVIRQGTFTEKMHNIDWLHSPALRYTIDRLRAKYLRFERVMRELHSMAVPTLDVDLAWHTYQLSPYQYMYHTVTNNGQYIDHDDKVVETKLSDAFAKTSKKYQQLYDEPYAQCTCWYCEATRESQTSRASRLFRRRSSGIKNLVHDEPDVSKSVHISAHNAVRPTDYDYIEEANVEVKKLEDAYARACKKAKLQGRKEPERDHYYYSDAYGYPVYLPAYSPFLVPLPYTPCLYTSNPSCMAYAEGAPGNCCNGTCGASQSGWGGCGALCGTNGVNCGNTSCTSCGSSGGGDGGSSSCGSGCGGCGGCGG